MRDKPNGGTRYQDRMHRILGACHQNGALWREGRASDGSRVVRTLLEAGEIQAPENAPFERYGLKLLDTSILDRVMHCSHSSPMR